jgi:Leucine-rich repeat (LRR) protein
MIGSYKTYVQIEHYLESLPEYTIAINVDDKGLFCLEENSCYGYFHGESLKILPSLRRFEHLTELRCCRNGLYELPSYLPSTLKVLECSENGLIKIPDVPPNMVRFNCAKNIIAELTNLPPNLISLICSHNAFRELPPLPKGLKYYVTINGITSENQPFTKEISIH